MFVGIRALLGTERRNIDAALEPTPSRQTGYLWAWLLAGYVILALCPNKGEERYALPLLPPIALLISGTIMTIGDAWVRRTVLGLAVIIGSANYLGLTYGLPGTPSKALFRAPWPSSATSIRTIAGYAVKFLQPLMVNGRIRRYSRCWLS